MQDKSELDSSVSTQAIIGLGKSKRLAAMRQSVERRVDREELPGRPIGNKKKQEVEQVRDVIAQRIVKIKSTYPQNMQNKLFALRYGSDEQINQMSLKELLKVLNIDQNLVKEFADVKYTDD